MRAAVVAADMVGFELKMRRRNEMVGERQGDVRVVVISVLELKIKGDEND